MHDLPWPLNFQLPSCSPRTTHKKGSRVLLLKHFRPKGSKIHPHKAPRGAEGFDTPRPTEAPRSPESSRRALPLPGPRAEGLPGVPSRAALAPAKVRRPPSLRCLVARWLEMVDVHMLCFHIRSQFLKRAEWKEKKKKKVCRLSIHSEETER